MIIQVIAYSINQIFLVQYSRQHALHLVVIHCWELMLMFVVDLLV